MNKKWGAVLLLLAILFSCTACAPTPNKSETEKTDDARNNSETQAISIGDLPLIEVKELDATDSYVAGTGILRVHFLDVGQGDAAFIELPDGNSMLIDTGNASNGSQIVDYIEDLGYKKIDYLVASHPHSDHIGGMEAVLDSFSIGEIYLPNIGATTQVFEDLLYAITENGHKISTAKEGEQIAPGILILSPSAADDYGDNLNDWSAVISITYGHRTFIFMGDAGASQAIDYAISADVLKVSHHGSERGTSENLLEIIQPDIAIISVGQENGYGHPSDTVLQALKTVGANVFRTDVNGTIIVETDGTTLTVETTGSDDTSITRTTSDPNPVPAGVTDTDPDDDDEITVYITKTGEKYHLEECRYLSKSMIPISLNEAKSRGYTPCSVCNPPQ